jgi:exopolysaccharide biosynthesis polyprenyl glycosylphosphotransferase
MLSLLGPNPRETAQKLNLVGDCLILAAASVAATMLPELHRIHWLVALGMGAAAMLVWGLMSRALRHYDVFNGRAVVGDIALTSVQLAVLLMVLYGLRSAVARYAIASDFHRFAIVALPGIAWLRLTINWVHHREIRVRDVLVVGIGPLGRHTGLEIRDGKNKDINVYGYLRFADEPVHDRLPAAIMGDAASLEEFLKKHVISEVYIAGNGDKHRAEMQQAIRVLERFGIPFALPACSFRFSRARPAHEVAVADGYVHYLSVRHKPLQFAFKRAFDIVASGAALVALAPLMIGVAIAIKLTSRGPVLFRQERVGYHGRAFNMLKFRSMVINAEELKKKLLAQNEQSGPVFKMKRDPRITAVGRWIRKFSIDELPQLINVLRGEMAVVGPRPPVPSEVMQYEAWQRRRFSVRPGLTCVWQVSGRNQISFEEWMYLDMQYIDHFSLAQDFALILKTIPVVVTGRGAS